MMAELQSTSPRGAREWFRQPHRPVAALLLALFSATALVWPILDYDNWTYHLPFSARLWDIGDSDRFALSSDIEHRWRGFPLAWEWIQGLLWAVTGSVRSMIVPQLALCFVFFALVGRTLQISRALLVLGFFASPMLLVHFQSLYLDLPAALCLALGFFLMMRAVNSGLGVKSFDAMAAISALGLAGNIKFQALLAVLMIAGVAAVTAIAWWRWSREAARSLAVIGLATALASASAAANLREHGNPVYPLQVNVGSATLFQGPEDPLDHADVPAYDVQGRSLTIAQPLAFLLSATELDWTIRGVAPRYNIDANAGDSPLDGAPSRTGGWGALFVLVNAILLLAQLARIRAEPDRLRKAMIVAAAGLVVLTALLPRSHELRYWLFLPLIVMPLNLQFLRQLLSERLAGMLLIVAALYSVAQTALSPSSYLILFRPPLPGMSAFPHPPPTIAAAVQERGRYCDSDPLLFRYSEAVTGTARSLSQRPEDCRR